jgi:hypothetical protein
VLLLALLPSVCAAECPGGPIRFEPLADGLWWVAGAEGETNANNRGHTANILVGVAGARLWLVGSGPSPVFGRRLACALRTRFGRDATDVISPWPKPELVAGVRGLRQPPSRRQPPLRHWAHDDVAQAMVNSCPRCMPQLAKRMGEAAADLEGLTVDLPTHTVRGTSGTLGPWRWWRLTRATGVPVTLWWWQAPAGGVAPVFAPGLLWSPGAPDGADTDAQAMAEATATALRLAQAAWTPGPRAGAAGAFSGAHGGPPVSGPTWLGEQGPVIRSDVAALQARYWHALLHAVRQAQDHGGEESAPAPELPGLESLSSGLRHTLNWQRSWRQEEDRSFQRSLR